MALICFLPGLNYYGMLDPTDSFFIEAAREMMQCKHYIIALANYIEWYEKPVLSFWSMILFYKIFGISAWAGRLPAALSGIILVISTYLFTLPKFGRRTAILASVILCTSPLFVIVGHVALADEFLSMLFGIAMFYAGLALTATGQKINLLGYVFLALAVLCKGPISIVLALLTIFLYLVIVNNSWESAKKNFLCLRPFSGFLIVLLLSIPYFYSAHVSTNGVFTQQFFLRQNLGRMQGTVNHQEALWYYIPIFFGGYFPWSVYLFPSLPWFKKLFLKRLNLNEKQKFVVFCACWFVVVASLFMSIPTKLYTYILPFSPAFAVLIASYLDRVVRSKRINIKDKKSSFWLLLPAGLCLIASIGAFLFLWFMRPMKIGLLTIVSAGLMSIAIYSARSLFWFLKRKYRHALLSLGLSSILACAILVPAFFRYFYEVHQVVFERAITFVQAKNGSLATLFSPVPSTSFYLQRQVPTIESMPQLSKFCQSTPKPHFLLASKNCLKLPELQAAKHIILSDGHWFLLNIDGFPWQN